MRRSFPAFIIGSLLFITSVHLATVMTIELVHSRKMTERYKISMVDTEEPVSNTVFTFYNQKVEIKESIKNKDPFLDEHSFKVVKGDLSFLLNGKQIESLRDCSIRLDEEGVDRYWGNVDYFILDDKKKNTTRLVVLIDKTPESFVMPNGDIAGITPEDKLHYNLYFIDTSGVITKESLSFKNRNALQTEILNTSSIIPYKIGYYTNAWQELNLFMPVYPFLTLIAGIVMMIVFFSF